MKRPVCDSNNSRQIFGCLKAITPQVNWLCFCTVRYTAGHIDLFAQILFVASNATWGTHVNDAVEQSPCPAGTAGSKKIPRFLW